MNKTKIGPKEFYLFIYFCGTGVGDWRGGKRGGWRVR
jgi:hypothetical protein